MMLTSLNEYVFNNYFKHPSLARQVALLIS